MATSPPAAVRRSRLSGRISERNRAWPRNAVRGPAALRAAALVVGRPGVPYNRDTLDFVGLYREEHGVAWWGESAPVSGGGALPLRTSSRRGTAALVVWMLLAAACGSPEMTTAQGTSAGGWTTLFAHEAWYASEPGAEREFTGVLEAVQDAGGVSTVQRRPRYRLGDRDVYTGATNLAALDALLGTRVVIRGKAVDMALEGARVREIWPAAVRPDP